MRGGLPHGAALHEAGVEEGGRAREDAHRERGPHEAPHVLHRHRGQGGQSLRRSHCSIATIPITQISAHHALVGVLRGVALRNSDNRQRPAVANGLADRTTVQCLL